MKAMAQMESELLMEEWLTDRGFEFEYEPDRGRSTRPDYFARRLGFEIVFEVEEFRPGASLYSTQNRGGSIDQRTLLKPVRNKIRCAAEQLKPLSDAGLPLVVVLMNNSGAPMPLAPHEVLAAMRGDMAFTFPVSRATGGMCGPGQMILSRNGKLTNDHGYVSGIAVIRYHDAAAEFRSRWSDANRHRWASIGDTRRAAHAFIEARSEVDPTTIPDGHAVSLDVFCNPSHEAEPLPIELFDGPRDRAWQFDAQGRVRQVHGPDTTT